jgi:hypothetical protein
MNGELRAEALKRFRIRAEAGIATESDALDVVAASIADTVDDEILEKLKSMPIAQDPRWGRLVRRWRSKHDGRALVEEDGL